MRWLAAAESGTGALVGATVGPYTAGEQTLALDLLAVFEPGMLVLADRNFLSHALATKVLATGATHPVTGHGVLCAAPDHGAGRGRLPGEAEPSPQSRWPADHGAGHRVHRAYHPDGGTTPSSELFCLVTVLLDIEAYPALDLACAYPMRWECKTVIGHHKTDMGTGVAVLRSKDPEGVAQEIGPCSPSTRPSAP